MSRLTQSKNESIVGRLKELYAKTQDAQLTIDRCDEEANGLVERLLEDMLDSVKAPIHQVSE